MKVYIISAKGYDNEFIHSKGFKTLEEAKQCLIDRFNFESLENIYDTGGWNTYGTHYSITEVEVE